ncbi:leukotriene B4 receptor 2a [Neoarius graeffei]|uniref:leukotriene B4 receptor 2a n=1 Tax=Neoarius graeffei TaxID=443677 RepID=UPI00298C7903|nr:leukotriene B4 receptor 2a [Neoarius graeffei]XP_060773123.1 leukotriene B4 receptor 2a [Neoarius graeffei]
MSMPTSPANAMVPTILTSSTGTMAGAVILSVAFILGIPGNLFVIWSIVARTQRRSVTTTLILNLACADGFLMVLTPFFIIYLIQRTWIFGLSMCKVLFYFCCANMYASIFLITLMSLHRLVAVVWPHRLATFSSRKTVVWTLLATWSLALVLAVPVLVFRKLEIRGNNTVCDCLHNKTEHAVMQYSLETALGFVLPYSLIVISYGRVLLRIRRTRFQRRIRSEKLILIIVVTFALFWLPYHIVNMLQVAENLLNSKGKEIRTIRTFMRPFAAAVAFVSSCINPILYMCVGKAYIRHAGLAFMARLFEATGRDSSSRKSHNQQREMAENDALRDKESESTTSANTSINIKMTHIQNGKQ